MVIVVSLLVILLTFGGSSIASAQETQPARGSLKVKKEKKPFLNIRGFVLGIVSGRVTGQRPVDGEGGDFVLGEERLRLEFDAATRSGELFFLTKGDLVLDAVGKEANVDIRESYLGYTKGAFDLRYGQQIVTWGIGDLFFINDVFPKDWESFFSGRPMEYLKLGVYGARTQFSSKAINLDFLVIPFFTPDIFPSDQRFIFFNPFPEVPDIIETAPVPQLSNIEFALRLYRRVARNDLSMVVYKGFWRSPSFRPDDPVSPLNIIQFYPSLSVFGASFQRGLLGGIMGFETGFYSSWEDLSGDNPNIPNSQWRFLAKYQHQLLRDFTATFQFYGELMNQYGSYRQSLPPGSPIQDQFRVFTSVRLTKWFLYQTLKLGLFAAFSPTDLDYFLQPEITYKITDNLGIRVGANIFGGQSETTFFGQFEKSDNVFLNVRYDFRVFNSSTKGD